MAQPLNYRNDLSQVLRASVHGPGMCIYIYIPGLFTPHRACAARGKVMAVGLYISAKKNFQKSTPTQEGFSLCMRRVYVLIKHSS